MPEGRLSHGKVCAATCLPGNLRALQGGVGGLRLQAEELSLGVGGCWKATSGCAGDNLWLYIKGECSALCSWGEDRE